MILPNVFLAGVYLALRASSLFQCFLSVFDSIMNNKIRQVLPVCTDGSCLPVFDVVSKRVACLLRS